MSHRQPKGQLATKEEKRLSRMSRKRIYWLMIPWVISSSLSRIFKGPGYSANFTASTDAAENRQPITAQAGKPRLTRQRKNWVEFLIWARRRNRARGRAGSRGLGIRVQGESNSGDWGMSREKWVRGQGSGIRGQGSRSGKRGGRGGCATGKWGLLKGRRGLGRWGCGGDPGESELDASLSSHAASWVGILAVCQSAALARLVRPGLRWCARPSVGVTVTVEVRHDRRPKRAGFTGAPRAA
jgi:hypothetical protein